jgi:hypothetical protein
MISPPACNILIAENHWLKTIRDSTAVDCVVCLEADVEQGIETAIWNNSSYMTNFNARKVIRRLWTPDGTAVAFEK